MLWVILIIIAVIVLLGYFLFLGPYNNFVKLRNLIQESWRQIDVELNRRYELIPNLVETVRAYAAHERNTLEEITRLRNQAAQTAQSTHEMPSQARAQAEEQLSGAVRNLMVSVEAYPDLKSNQNFLELQRELTDTEDRIAAGRRYYNANVRAYNTKIESVPSNIVAGMFHFEKATYFEVKDQQVRQSPNVNFGEISYRGDEGQQNNQITQGQQPQSYASGNDFNQQQAPQQQYQQAPQQQAPQQQQYQQPMQQQAPQQGQQPGSGYQPPYGQQ